MKIDELLDALIDREGGYSNHPSDRGGPTKFGITEAVARAHGYSGAMRNLPREEAAVIYKRLYWIRPRFDEVAKRSEAIAAELFDTGVNMGPAVAATFLQRALSALNSPRPPRAAARPSQPSPIGPLTCTKSPSRAPARRTMVPAATQPSMVAPTVSGPGVATVSPPKSLRPYRD